MKSCYIKVPCDYSMRDRFVSDIQNYVGLDVLMIDTLSKLNIKHVKMDFHSPRGTFGNDLIKYIETNKNELNALGKKIHCTIQTMTNSEQIRIIIDITSEHGKLIVDKQKLPYYSSIVRVGDVNGCIRYVGGDFYKDLKEYGRFFYHDNVRFSNCTRMYFHDDHLYLLTKER
jgi:hypothetical protein